jgi:hypothetical protein
VGVTEERTSSAANGKLKWPKDIPVSVMSLRGGLRADLAGAFAREKLT